ncbi:MAG TPA: M1 family aminopeptidase [Terriglobia bacterium]|nr:M1 family aminopeptidase [Terriglobia bacterium]
MEQPNPEPGVSLTLATKRAQSIDSLSYDLSFTIPSNPSEPITGHEIIRFSTKDITQPLVLDFTPGADYLKSISIAGRPSHYRLVQDHIIIPTQELASEENAIDIQFRAGDASLNRNPEFMYTLFVPARAHLAFPCFDQPNLKARFSLELNIPKEWQAVSNGAETFHEAAGDQVRIRYAETQPIPTYLFAFAAGKFQVETEQRNGRWYRMFHRETDGKKVERNKKAIFDLHASSLEWLEKYTAIPYRFGKFDFVLIPSFQFGGMEHPGSIFYNAASILLDESATENQLLNRATTIAHETSHMWFGDLVTMQWFNDVWMKEVFANFMAAKIVNPAFPNVNHDLRFLVSYYPSAYAVDRTGGTHPIRQELANLDEAGSLYGNIIYDKAPIVMRQLELLLGPEELQNGLRSYLKEYQFGNATWLDLIKILNEHAKLDLNAWSHAWVEEAGRPSIQTEITGRDVSFVQSDPQSGRSLKWTEKLDVLVGPVSRMASIPVELANDRTQLKGLRAGGPAVDFILPTGGGLGYGDFTLDRETRAFLLQHLPEFKDPLTRGAAWVTLWEEMLDKRIQPMDFVSSAMTALNTEDTEQNIQLVLSDVDDAFWIFLSDAQRKDVGPKLEQVLRAGIDRSKSSTTKATYFAAYRSTVTTPEGVAFLQGVWGHKETIPGLKLAEPDEATMALELAVRSVPDAAAILEEQRGRFMNPDRKARFEFVMPALSEQQQTRDAWFDSLKDVKNRRREPWVLEGLQYLHHPLRAASSEKYIRPSLDLLVEIQRTGDIFFPTRWMNATLGGHNTRSAGDTVRKFLAEQKDYPIRLHRIILQAADDLFRAAGS